MVSSKYYKRQYLSKTNKAIQRIRYVDITMPHGEQPEVWIRFIGKPQNHMTRNSNAIIRLMMKHIEHTLVKRRRMLVVTKNKMGYCTNHVVSKINEIFRERHAKLVEKIDFQGEHLKNEYKFRINE